MPPKKKGKGKGSLKKTKTTEVPRDTPPALHSLVVMMMMMMKKKRVFRMWSLAIHRAYKED